MKKVKEEFTQKEVAEATGINFNTIALYANRGIFIANKSNPKGKGSTRIYSRENLLELIFLKELVRNGITLEDIKKQFKRLRRYEFERIKMLVNGKNAKDKLNNLPNDVKNRLEYFTKESEFDENQAYGFSIFTQGILNVDQIYYIRYKYIGIEKRTFEYFSHKIPKTMQPNRLLPGEVSLKRYTSMLVIDMAHLIKQIKKA